MGSMLDFDTSYPQEQLAWRLCCKAWKHYHCTRSLLAEVHYPTSPKVHIPLQYGHMYNYHQEIGASFPVQCTLKALWASRHDSEWILCLQSVYLCVNIELHSPTLSSSLSLPFVQAMVSLFSKSYVESLAHSQWTAYAMSLDNNSGSCRSQTSSNVMLSFGILCHRVVIFSHCLFQEYHQNLIQWLTWHLRRIPIWVQSNITVSLKMILPAFCEHSGIMTRLRNSLLAVWKMEISSMDTSWHSFLASW